jgi:hypothetical protein
MSTQPLTISQGALLPPVEEKATQQISSGYTETPDSLTTTGYTDRPVVVHYPEQGANVQFPSLAHAQTYASDVYHQLKSAVAPSAEFLGNEVKGAGQMVMGLPSAIADSVTVAPTADEQKSIGVSANPSWAEKAALALYRNLGEPIQNAAQWYGTLVRHHQNIIDAIPQDVLAQGIGAGAGAAVLGKVLAPAEAGGVPVAGTPVAEIGKQLAVREHGEVGLPGTVGEPFTQKETATAPKQPVVAPKAVVPEPPDAPTFFSKAAQVATDKLPASASGDQILATLKNNGVKQSEMDWLGLPEYLQGKAKVSKADVEQFIDEHKIQLEETTLGGREHIDSALADLRKQRDQAMAVNNRTYADDLRYHPDTPALFNAMKEGEDVDGIIAKIPSNLQESARKFVDSENQIHAIDKQITDLENQPANKPARFGQYTLPGDKQNYKELLLRLPEQDNISALKDQLAEADTERTHYLQTLRPVPGDVELRFQDAQKAVRQAENKSTAFKSSHFDEPDILAHVRFDDRTMPDGKKALFLEEVQSDWAQKGKREGFANPAPTKLPDGIYITPDDDQFQVVNREGNPLLRRTFASESEARAAALQHYGEGAGNPGVPDMPFKQDWHELAIKRMLRHAAENGYDQLAWTTGEQQAARYDLSKHIGRVTYDPTDSTLQAFDPSGNNVLIETVDPTANAISEYIGKEPAQKLMEKIDAYGPAAEGQDEPDIPELKGLDLKVGGEWAKALYDRAIPRFLNKYASKWGAKVDQSDISTTNPGTLRYEIVDPKGQVQDAFRNRQGAEDAVRGYQESHRGPKWTIHDNGTTEKIWTMPITPEMKRSVLKSGQPIAKAEQPSWRAVALHELGSREAA